MYRDLTKGSITKALLLFALPMAAGDLLQQFYNIADTLIVGQALGKNALAAVGAVSGLLAVSASDRTGLLYGIARVLAAHAISVELAKITTLGERVEDVFLLRGESLQEARTRVGIEQELLRALASGG